MKVATDKEKTTMENQHFLSMAIAYLEVGKVAAEANTSLKNEGNYQNAVAYQLFHAIELFYKLMIKNRAGGFSHIHDLKKLEEKYSSLYPGNSHKINHPFDFSIYDHNKLNEDEGRLFAEHMTIFNPKYLDQHLRYPADTRTGGYSFCLDSSVFEEIKNKMLDIYEPSR